MGNKNLAYRHPDEPVTVNGTFAKRVQSVELTDNIPTTTVDEMGNLTPAGVSQNPALFTGSIRWFPIDNAMENLFCGTSGSTVDLFLLTNNPGVTVQTPKSTMGGCRIIGGTYAVQDPNSEFTATYNWKGASFATDQSNSIVPAAPTGVGAYRGRDVSVQVTGGAVAVRCAGMSGRFEFPNQELYELNNQAMVGVAMDSPRTTMTIDFYESDLIAGNVSPVITSPKDITVVVGSSAKTLVFKNMVGGGQSQRGTVRGWATRQYNYTGSGDATTLGLSIA